MAAVAHHRRHPLEQRELGHVRADQHVAGHGTAELIVGGGQHHLVGAVGERVEGAFEKNNVIALAKAARLTKTPTFTTASVPDGPNGPLIPEIHQANPEAVYIPRTGQINAWDNPKWVEAIQKTGRKTLIIAGTLTSVCMAFPTLSALEAGYKVFNVVDASGNYSALATDVTLARVVQAGAVPTDTFATLAGLMSTWNRPDAMEFAAVMKDHIVPHYQLLFESFEKAQRVQKEGRETKLDRLEK